MSQKEKIYLSEKSFSGKSLTTFAVVFALLASIYMYNSYADNPNLTADINNDNKVDVIDLSSLLSSYGTNNTASDLNDDGVVNILDLSVLLTNYNRTYIPPTQPPPPPTAGWPDRSLSAWNSALPSNISVVTVSPSQFSTSLIKPGVLVDVVGSGTINGYQRYDGRPSSMAYVRFGPGVRINGQVELRAANLSIYGGEIYNSPHMGLTTTNCNNVRWWGGKIHDSAATGYFAHSNVGPNVKLDIALELYNNGLDLSKDPHAEKGTGLHGSYIGSSDAGLGGTEGTFVLDVHDQPYGAAVQWGNQGKGTLWLKARNIMFIAQSQVGGNVLQLWGSSNAGLIVEEIQYSGTINGRVVETDALSGSSNSIQIKKSAPNSTATVRLSKYAPSNGIVVYGNVQ